MTSKKQSIFYKYPKTTLFITYFIFLSLALVIIELICQIWLNTNGKSSYDLVFNLNVGEECTQSNFDPLLGYAHSKCTRNSIKQIPSFVVYPSNSPQSQTSRPMRIVTLGGSTTDPILFSGDSRIGADNWSKLLRDRCQEKQLFCDVYNGGSGGFTSSQELLKLVRDVEPLQPNIVISFNGINEWYFYNSRLARYPYISKYQQDFALKFVTNGQASRFGSGYRGNLLNRFMPNFREFINNSLISASISSNKNDESSNSFEPLKLNFGSPYDLKPWDIWFRNVKLMHFLSNFFGAEYYVFLQPTMGVGNYNYSDQDLAIKEQRNSDYYVKINELYDQLRLKCRELDYCIDLSDLFQGQSNLYRDPRHPNSQGNRLQAEAIFDVLVQNGHFD